MTASATALVIVLQPFSFLSLPSPIPTQLSNLGVAAPVLAADGVTYKPPIRPRPLGRTSGTGSRGCDSKALPAPLTLLVPGSHVGQTVSGRPTFFWYSPDTTPVKFALVESGVPRPILEKTVQVTKPGIMQLKLPKDAQELTVGKEYRWSISIACNPNRPSNDTFTQSFIERVALNAELSNQLEAAKSDRERARVFAKAGMWYDALATLAQASTVQPSVHTDFLLLLDQVGLTEITTRERIIDQAAKP
ncbi:MAG: DUF928 domain-containing protein [Kovacikia sp.]